MPEDERPQLPSSTNPYVILGLDPDAADAREVRRAYARLIKIFRPDRDPDGFRRVRAAFEQVSNPEVALASSCAQAPGEDVVGAPAQHPAEYLLDDPESLLARFDGCLVDGDVETVREILSLRRVKERAGTEREIADVCLRAIAGLAWRGESVQELLWAYSQGPNAAELQDEVERVELEIRVAARLRGHSRGLPTSVVALLAGASTAAFERARDLRRRVHVLLLEQGPDVLARIDALRAAEPEVVDLLSTWFAGRANEPPPALGELDESTFRETTNLMVGGGALSRLHPTQWWRVFMYYLPLWPFALVVSLVANASWRIFAAGRYRRRGRHQLAEVAILAGVPAETLVEWLQANRKLVPGYRWFHRYLHGDRAIRLLGHIAWYVQPHQLDGSS